MTDPTVPFDGYDDLTIEQFAARVDALDDEARTAVLVYETANRNRKGVLALVTPPDDDLAVPVTHFATTPSLGIPVAGLLEDRPELADAELTPAEWQAALDAYLASPRP